MEMRKFLNWIIGNSRIEKTTSYERLLYTIRSTAKCRFYASKRIELKSKFSFFISIFTSLLLILIALFQLGNINIFIPKNTLNIIQVFSAIILLVYSIIISESHFDIRINDLVRCGNELKDLTRRLMLEKADISDEKLQTFTHEYGTIIIKSESHDDIDYIRAQLDLRDYQITGIKWISYQIQIVAKFLIDNFFSLLILCLDAMIVLDLFNLTRIFSHLFK